MMHLDRLLRPGSLAAALLLLAAATEMKFRGRAATEALEGAVDAQILGELAVWGLVVSALALAVLLRRGGTRAFLPQAIGPALRVALLIAGLAFSTSFVTGTPVALVRGVQYLLMTAIAVVAARVVRETPDGLAAFWVTLRRGLWLVVGLATLGTLALHGTALVTLEGAARYAWFAMHPIATATVVGLALTAFAGAVFGLPDPWLNRASRLAAATPGALLAALLAAAAKARGALVASLAAILFTVLLCARGTRRGLAVVSVTALTGAVLSGLGLETLEQVLTRGRPTAELLTLTGRTQLFRIAAELVAERPLLGYGFTASRGVFLEAVPWAGHAHNLFVDVAVSFGLVGVALWVALFGCLLWPLRAALRAPLSPSVLVMRESAAFVVFVLVAGVVGPGPASLPGFELAALLAVAVAADSWRANPDAAGGGADRPARLRAAGG